MNEILQEFEKRLADAGLTVELQLSEEPALIYADSEMLREALRRLLDNAARYGRPESKRIWLSIEQVAIYIGLRVRDEGRGIPPEMVERFATPFEQVDRDNRTDPGAGLSLALIRHVAHLHGGNLEISSQYGRGSIFTLWLPAAVDSEQ